MLTRKQQEILRVLHTGRPLPIDRYDPQLQELIEKKYVVERDGIYELSDTGLEKLRLARGFGGAIADVLLPGAGSDDASRS